jgi:hypothetical protein
MACNTLANVIVAWCTCINTWWWSNEDRNMLLEQYSIDLYWFILFLPVLRDCNNSYRFITSDLWKFQTVISACAIKILSSVILNGVEESSRIWFWLISLTEVRKFELVMESITLTLVLSQDSAIYMCVLNALNSCSNGEYWVFGLCPSSGILKSTTMRKLDVSILRCGGGRHLLCWVR